MGLCGCLRDLGDDSSHVSVQREMLGQVEVKAATKARRRVI